MNGHGFDSETKAKRVLLRRLGLLGEEEPLSVDALARYSKLFERQLAIDVMLAFADFFGWKLLQDLLTNLPSGRAVATSA